MNTIYKIVSHIGFSIVAALTATSALAETGNSYQMKTLFQPSEHQLKREAKGSVYIYDGLTDKTVSKAMDSHPDRIASMMFVNTKITDEKGNLRRDPASGEILVEDDGC